MAEPDKTSWIYCNLCKHSTRHVLVTSKKYNHSSCEEDGEPVEWGEYRLWACAGCDTCAMEDYYTTSYMIAYGGDVTDGENQIYESIYHPKRASSSRPSKHFVKLPAELNTLYSEVIKSKNEGLHLLCAAGLRSLLEGVCANKGIRGSNLEKKIDGMKGSLPESIVTNLHEFRFMGNRAVHELEAPKGFELGLALDVIEDILNFFYALDYKASLLAKVRAAQREPAQAIPAPPTVATPIADNVSMPAKPLQTKLDD
jgi:hypothetical protein